MERKVKQQVIGVVVILALAIIIIPAVVTKKMSKSAYVQAQNQPAFPRLSENKVDLSAPVSAEEFASLAQKTIQSSMPGVSEEQVRMADASDALDHVKDTHEAIKAKNEAQQDRLQENHQQKRDKINQHRKKMHEKRLDKKEKVEKKLKDKHQNHQKKINHRIRKQQDAKASSHHGFGGHALTRMHHPKQAAAETKPPLGAYVVQLGSFDNKVHADNLVKKLRQYNFRAFAYTHGKHTRVYVGPSIKVADARALENALQHDFGQRHALIVHYNHQIV